MISSKSRSYLMFIVGTDHQSSHCLHQLIYNGDVFLLPPNGPKCKYRRSRTHYRLSANYITVILRKKNTISRSYYTYQFVKWGKASGTKRVTIAIKYLVKWIWSNMTGWMRDSSMGKNTFSPVVRYWDNDTQWSKVLKWKRHYLSLQSWHSPIFYDVWIFRSWNKWVEKGDLFWCDPENGYFLFSSKKYTNYLPFLV